MHSRQKQIKQSIPVIIHLIWPTSVDSKTTIKLCNLLCTSSKQFHREISGYSKKDLPLLATVSNELFIHEFRAVPRFGWTYSFSSNWIFRCAENIERLRSRAHALDHSLISSCLLSGVRSRNPICLSLEHINLQYFGSIMNQPHRVSTETEDDNSASCGRNSWSKASTPWLQKCQICNLRATGASRRNSSKIYLGKTRKTTVIFRQTMLRYCKPGPCCPDIKSTITTKS